MVRIRPQQPPKERRCRHYYIPGVRCQERVANNFCFYHYRLRSGRKLSVGEGNVWRRSSDGEVINPPPPQPGLRCRKIVANNFCFYRYRLRSGRKLSVGEGNVRRRISVGEVINPPPPQGSQAGGERCGKPRVSCGKVVDGGFSDGRRHKELADGIEDENVDTRGKTPVVEIHSEATESMAEDDEIPVEMFIAEKERAKMRKREHLEKRKN